MTKQSKRALFLDRDGVINHDSGYTSRIDKFAFIDGIFDLCRAAKRFEYLIIVVTNQAGIGRGYYSEREFFALTDWMREQFSKEGAPLTEVFYCPYHPEYGVGQYKKDSYNRKPHPGMFLQAAKKHKIDMKYSIMIGDKNTDMLAAERAGVGVRCHYLSSGNENEFSPHLTFKAYSIKECISQLVAPSYQCGRVGASSK